MPPEIQSMQWPGKRAILLVHGIGNAAPGDYASLLTDVRTALGPDANGVAIYQLFYDQVNDWFASKTQLGTLLDQAVSALATQIADNDIGDALAESVGDILWPVLVADARTAVREAYLAQLKQIVLDGVAAGVPQRRQQITIICHSLGCFHTYEALHHVARFPSHALQPATHEVTFANVIFMASPVQMIRTVAGALGNLVPNKRWLYAIQGSALAIPFEETLTGMKVPSVKRWVSITGDLDPVGGFFFRNKAPWAYMDIPTQVSRIDNQSALGITSKADLRQRLVQAMRDREPPHITPQSPHDWGGYVQRNAAELQQWIVA
jgi:hypothetical protein